MKASVYIAVKLGGCSGEDCPFHFMLAHELVSVALTVFGFPNLQFSLDTLRSAVRTFLHLYSKSTNGHHSVMQYTYYIAQTEI